jgi:hypothetical protein
MDNLPRVENEELASLYEKMLISLDRSYKNGFYRWLEKENPHLAKRLVILDEKINEVWEKCTKGEATLIMFKAGVKFYEDTVRKALVEY